MNTEGNVAKNNETNNKVTRRINKKLLVKSIIYTIFYIFAFPVIYYITLFNLFIDDKPYVPKWVGAFVFISIFLNLLSVIIGVLMIWVKCFKNQGNKHFVYFISPVIIFLITETTMSILWDLSWVP